MAQETTTFHRPRQLPWRLIAIVAIAAILLLAAGVFLGTMLAGESSSDTTQPTSSSREIEWSNYKTDIGSGLRVATGVPSSIASQLDADQLAAANAVTYQRGQELAQCFEYVANGGTWRGRQATIEFVETQTYGPERFHVFLLKFPAVPSWNYREFKVRVTLLGNEQVIQCEKA